MLVGRACGRETVSTAGERSTSTMKELKGVWRYRGQRVAFAPSFRQVLRLVYAPEAASRVRAMVEKERLCCAFLTIDVFERPDAVCVRITVPEAAQAALDVLLRSFLPVENAGPAV